MGPGDANGYHLFLPQITKKDFDTIEFDFFDKPIAELPQLVPAQRPAPLVLNRAGDASKLVGQSSTITNYFGQQRLIGKSTTCAHHMGTSARQLSLDLQVITGPEGDTVYDELNKFKEVSDELVRTEAVYDRVMGWEVKCVCSKIMGGSTSTLIPVSNGVYVPLVHTSNTTETPHLKTVAISLVEQNTRFNDTFQIILESGGQSEKEMRDLFFGTKTGKGILTGEREWRRLSLDGQDLARQNGDHTWSAANVFWPISLGVFFDDTSSGSAIMNRDVLRAALFRP
jgi:hypothetical protein